MKRFIIIIIIVLGIILIGQSIYYNFFKETVKENTLNSLENITVNTQNLAKDFSNEISTNKIEEVVVPEGIANFSVKYNGNLEIKEMQKELYKFVNSYSKTIHNATTGKSISYILQYYDLHTQEINKMGIYSSEDYLNIARQINLLNQSDKYKSSKIEMDSYEETLDGYTKVQVILIYESNNTIELSVYLANDVTTLPNIKFSSGV